MDDCDDPTFFERASGWLITVGCAIMGFLRRMQRPGVKLTGLVVVAYGAVQIAKASDWPHKSTWTGWWGKAAFIALAVSTTVGTLFVVWGFHRVLKKATRHAQLQRAAKSFAHLVEEKTTLTHDQIGVNVWLIKGMTGFRRLVREASEQEPRDETPIRWTKGKGIIGEAWARNRSRHADLDAVRELFPTPEDWCRVARGDRFRLSWEEFGHTRRYNGVLAVPVRRRRFAKHRIRAIVAIDVLAQGKGQEIKGIQELPEFRNIMSVCQAALAGDE